MVQCCHVARHLSDIVERHASGQPVLVGTVSVEKSELLSQMLRRRGVPHAVLNAKFHAKEAEIIAQAGRKGAVTVATNMAGRGTDILLGGNAEYLAAADLRQRGVDPESEDYEDAFDDARLTVAKHALEGRLRAEGTTWTSSDELLKFGKKEGNHLRLSTPRVILAADARSELNELYQRLVRVDANWEVPT